MAVWTRTDLMHLLRAPKVEDTPQQRLERIFPLDDVVSESVAIDRVMREFPQGKGDAAWASGLLSTFVWSKVLSRVQDPENGQTAYQRTADHANMDTPLNTGVPEINPAHRVVEAHDVPVMITINDPESGEKTQIPHPTKTRHVEDRWFHTDGEECLDPKCHGPIQPLIWAVRP